MRQLIISILCCAFILSGCDGRPAVPNGYGHYRNNRPALPTGGRNNTSKPTSHATPGKKGKTIISSNVSNAKMSGQEVFKECNSAVFMIFTSTGYEGYQGSGFFISSDGLAVSNYHVFKGTGMGLETIKLADGQRFKIKEVIRKDKENDVMIFRVALSSNSKCNFIPLSNRKPQVGDKVYAIGSPRGLENTFSSGEVSQLRESNIIQISAPIDHGSSGGALINEYGEAIGITSAGLDYSGANLNFAVSTDVVKRYVKL